MAKIHLDDGYTIRFTPSGQRVYMRKSEPGIFLDPNGDPVSDAVATEAGFAVAEARKEQKIQAKLAKDRQRYETELRESEIRTRLEEDPPYRLKYRGGGFWDLYDRENALANEKPLRKEVALERFQELTAAALSAALGRPLEKHERPGPVEMDESAAGADAA